MSKNHKRERLSLQIMVTIWIISIIASFVFISFNEPIFFVEIAIESVLLVSLFMLGLLTTAVEHLWDSAWHPRISFWGITLLIGIASTVFGFMGFDHHRWYLGGMTFPTLYIGQRLGQYMLKSTGKKEIGFK